MNTNQNPATTTPLTDEPEPISNDTEEEPTDPPPMTLLQAVEGLASNLMRIAKKTKMSETGVMNIYSFFYQQEEAARMRMEQEARVAATQGQAAVDKVAHEALEAQEVITGTDD